MMPHLIYGLAAIALLVLCIVLPYLPGRYDPLAAPLSAMACVFGRVGLLP